MSRYLCSRTGRPIGPGDRYRTYFRGLPWESRSLVDDSTDAQAFEDAARIGRAHLIPPIEVMS